MLAAASAAAHARDEAPLAVVARHLDAPELRVQVRAPRPRCHRPPEPAPTSRETAPLTSRDLARPLVTSRDLA